MILLRTTVGRAALAGAALAVAALAAPPAALADCWGCAEYTCTFGFRTGGFLCTEVKGECTLMSRLTGTCAAQTCYTSDPCANGERPAQPIVKPEPVEPKGGEAASVDGAPGTDAPAGSGGAGIDPRA